MMPGLLAQIAYNIDHGVDSVHLYESVASSSAIRTGASQSPCSSRLRCVRLCLMTAGAQAPPLNFFDARVSSGLLDALRIVRGPPGSRSSSPQLARIVRQVIAQGEAAGWATSIHVTQELRHRRSVVAELSVAALTPGTTRASLTISPRFPASIDLARRGREP